MKPALLAVAWVALLLLATNSKAADEDYAQSVNQFLHRRFDQRRDCMVIGFVDAHGTTILAAGRLDNGADQPVDGDSVFFIGSVSKTFTALLLEDMARRGDMRLDDAVARYLPASVVMPMHGGKEITLLDLATHASGLPINPGNMTGEDVKEQYETYTVEKMYAFLSSYRLTREPGTEFEYSNVGMALLGHAMAVKAGATFESLLVDRICRPLHMDSTCITPTPQLKAHVAMGHDNTGKPSPPWEFQAYVPVGSIHSTANDLLKYVSAEAGITTTALTPLMEQTQVIRHEDSRGLSEVPQFGTFGHTAMDWFDHNAWQPPGSKLLGHGGGAGSYHAFIGFDLKQHRGVVVLTTANDLFVEAVGWTLLQRRPLNSHSAAMFAQMRVGVGIALNLDQKTQTLSISSVFCDSPGDQAGLAAGMVIQRINDVAVAGKTLQESLALLRGNAGTRIHFQLLDSSGKPKLVEVTTRSYVLFPPSESGES